MRGLRGRFFPAVAGLFSPFWKGAGGFVLRRLVAGEPHASERCISAPLGNLRPTSAEKVPCVLINAGHRRRTAAQSHLLHRLQPRGGFGIPLPEYVHRKSCSRESRRYHGRIEHTGDRDTMAPSDRLETLRQQREKLARKIRREETRLKGKARSDETRRKILDGALVQKHAADHPDIAALLERLRNEGLKRANDRALFGLEPLQDKGKD